MSKREKKIVTVVFVICIVIGLFAVQGYGINIDENTEIDIARMDLKEYVRLFFGESSRLYQFMDSLIGNLMDSVEIDHGEALLYPVVAVVSVLRVIGRTDLGMLVYHMYLYIWFLVGLLAVYQTGKFLTGKPFLSAMGAAFIGLSPVMFGNAFINNKDMVMLTLTSLCIYTGIRFVEPKSRKWSVLWAVTAAFCVNMRIIGLMFVGLFGGLYLYEFLSSREKKKEEFLNGLLAAVIVVIVFIAITPATWYSLTGYFQYTISSSTGFLRWNGYELYCGKLYRYLENNLPWHYFFVCYGVTTPLFFLAALIAGQVGCVYLIAAKWKEQWNFLKYMLICAIIIWLPMLVFIVKGANVTFRHFFFIYPPMVFMAVYVLNQIAKNRKAEKILYLCGILQMLWCAGLIVVGHPFESTYFNILAGKNVEEKFEYANLDYYKAALEQVLRMDSADSIVISSDNLNCYYGIKQAWEVLNPKEKNRIQVAEPETEACENADYHVYGESIFIKENMEAQLGLEELKKCDPDSKFNTSLGLDAYGKRVITIYYNR